MTINFHTVNVLRNLADLDVEFEACGVILQDESVVSYYNMHSDPKHNFYFELDVAGVRSIWHSHPHGPAEPSGDDLPCMQYMAENGFYYITHIIVSPNTVAEYQYDIAASRRLSSATA
jgi:proteasome lid subunit RPN8/RPN11